MNFVHFEENNDAFRIRLNLMFLKLKRIVFYKFRTFKWRYTTTGSQLSGVIFDYRKIEL